MECDCTTSASSYTENVPSAPCANSSPPLKPLSPTSVITHPPHCGPLLTFSAEPSILSPPALCLLLSTYFSILGAFNLSWHLSPSILITAWTGLQNQETSSTPQILNNIPQPSLQGAIPSTPSTPPPHYTLHLVLTYEMDCCCLVAQSCLTIFTPMDCCMPGFPVLYYLPEFAQTHVHWAPPTISSSVPPLLLLPSIFPSIRVFSKESALCIRWPKYWSFSFSISPSSGYSGLISFRIEMDMPTFLAYNPPPKLLTPPQFLCPTGTAQFYHFPKNHKC